MTRHVVEEVGGEFVIPLNGFVATYVQNDAELILCAPDSSDEAWVWASRLKRKAILRLVRNHASVERAVGTSDSTLRIEFDDGFSLVNPPEKKVEAWEVRGPGHVLVIGTPGKGAPLYEMPEWSEYDLQFRQATCGGDAFELHPADAPPLNRGQIMRFVPSSGRGPYLRITN